MEGIERRMQAADAGRAALAALPAAERGASVLLNQVAVLLEEQGRREEARPLYDEAVATVPFPCPYEPWLANAERFPQRHSRLFLFKKKQITISICFAPAPVRRGRWRNAQRLEPFVRFLAIPCDAPPKQGQAWRFCRSHSSEAAWPSSAIVPRAGVDHCAAVGRGAGTPPSARIGEVG